MTLIRSISGIRGTIGDKRGDNLTPEDIVKFTSAYAIWVKRQTENNLVKVVVGRDARPSGKMVYHIVCGTLISMGIDVIDLDLATTPTVEMAITAEEAQGGIILTASHNPVQWNALKLLNFRGEFLNKEEGEEILDIAAQHDIDYAAVDQLGAEIRKDDYLDYHIHKILELPQVDVDAISSKEYRVVVDGINSVGGIAVPRLLRALDVKEVIEVNCEPDGRFAHNPEPLPENLTGVMQEIQKNNADLGFVVDPDVDRLAIVDENGSMFGEEYTLVAVADYILQNKPGNTVSNLSSTKALRELTAEYGGSYYPSAVGEVNVVEKMKEAQAVIGGEGNGGVILPELHYGRDALVGIALFLTHLAKAGVSCSELRKKYPFYHISKNKIQLTPDIDVDHILEKIKNNYKDYPLNDVDGVRIEFPEGWVHLRKSNTEPIIRIYSEGEDRKTAEELASRIIDAVNQMV
ncbi:MAG: phosphoglucosamine mutase [Bacteroidales bacterium]|nr:phosphoglucosamine mutase [Bacteroidales bacterium]